MNKKQKTVLKRIIISAALTLAGIILNILSLPRFLSLIFFIFATIIVGYDVLIEAVNNIMHAHLLDENFLMTIGCIGAYILGDFTEGTLILLLYQIGELFQSVAVGKSRKSIAELMDIRPDYANIEKDGKIKEVDPYAIETGTEIVVFPGEKVPIDCVVLKGTSEINAASLTGESLPFTVKQGDMLLSGSINLTQKLYCNTVKTFENSAVSVILDLVENATAKKAKSENFVRRFAKYYTPSVVFSAIALCLLMTVITKDFSTWLYRSIMFLVASCPCALVVSVPLTFFGSIGAASKNGILVKGSNYFEILAKTDTVIFDKTGTLTKGNFEVTKIIKSVSNTADVLKLAAICEQGSPHPIAKAILKYCENFEMPKGYEQTVISGKGMECKLDNKILLVGNEKLMKDHGIEIQKNDSVGTVVYVALDGNFEGTIVLNDAIKDTSYYAVKSLSQQKIKTVMLTGDKAEIANSVADKLEITEVYPELLPNNKVEITEQLLNKTKGKIVFVGDGINDAPVLARADIGVAMGNIGSDAAIEAADLVIMNDDLRLILAAINIGKKALKISKQNITFALFIKFLSLVLSLFGLINIFGAVLADVGVLIIAILNSMRTLKYKNIV